MNQKNPEGYILKHNMHQIEPISESSDNIFYMEANEYLVKIW